MYETGHDPLIQLQVGRYIVGSADLHVHLAVPPEVPSIGICTITLSDSEF
jgi:hypothetical protein